MVIQLYDRIGRGYAQCRRPDPRLATAIERALGPARTIVNVGAGTGSYEPSGSRLVAVEPSMEMIRQRPSGSAPAVRAVAEALPFRDGAFDAALAILTMHHWADWRRGVSELKRVASRIVLFTFDADVPGFWLTEEYFPEITLHDRACMPGMSELEDVLGGVEVRPVPIPEDCSDGFLGAYWKRPHAYLQPEVRRSISALADVEATDPRLDRLAADLESGAWEQRHAHLRGEHALDLGYRLVIAGGGAVLGA